MKLVDRQVLNLFLFRGASFAVTLWIVPLSLSYLDPVKYGVWQTLGSALSWLLMFDVGLGNGLRNRLAESIANEDTDAARSYISSTYAALAIGVLIAVAIFEVINPFLPWELILNATSLESEDLQLLAALVIAFWGVRLILGLINAVSYAFQEPSIPGLIDFLSNVFAAIGIVILAQLSHGSLFWYGVVFSGAVLLGPALASLVLFGLKYRDYSPSCRYVDLERAKDLSGLGVQFFLLQVAGVVQYSSANVLISQLFGPAEVTPFSIATRYFNIPMVVFATLLTPFWSQYTRDYARGELKAIAKSIRSLSLWWLLVCLAVLGMVIASDWVFLIWIGHQTKVPILVCSLLGLYVLMQTWCNIYVNLINGTGKVRLQVMVAALTMVFFVPLAYGIATRLLIGSAGIVLAMCLVLAPLCVLWPMQVRRILSGSDTGVWGR